VPRETQFAKRLQLCQVQASSVLKYYASDERLSFAGKWESDDDCIINHFMRCNHLLHFRTVHIGTAYNNHIFQAIQYIKMIG
jgi:hypothetical protein